MFQTNLVHRIAKRQTAKPWECYELMQTHLILRSLRTNDDLINVKVAFSVQPERRALLFINGFSTDVEVWSEFRRQLMTCRNSKGYDYFFYGYNGLKSDLDMSAKLLHNVLNKIFQATAELVNMHLPQAARRSPEFAYDKSIIVAHSVGAVFVRRAILDATKMGTVWPSKTNLFLYAPAHLGAKIPDLALRTSTQFPSGNLFEQTIDFQSPLVDQLRPGSCELKRLLSETKKACACGGNSHLIPRKVVVAQNDDIITNGAFGDDPPSIQIANATHTNLCKPNDKCAESVMHLEEWLL